MKKILIAVMFLFAITSCQTKYNTIDTGLAKGRFDGNMFEYLQSNTYDWSLTSEMIVKGGLQDLFQGNRAGFEKITFFGPTNHSIRRWALNSKKYINAEGKVDVALMPTEVCEEIILRHVIKGKYMRDDIPRGVSSDPIGTKGMTVDNSAKESTKIWIYTMQAPYQGIPDVGPVTIHLMSFLYKISIDVASSNIEPDNGVVHSLSYEYTLGTL